MKYIDIIPVFKGISTLLFLVSLTTAQAATVTLVWCPSTSTSVTGYRVYHGQTSGSYTTTTPPAPNLISKTVCGTGPCACTYTTPDLPSGTYFAIKAFDSAGNESGFSNEVKSAVAALPVASFTVVPTGGTTTTLITFTDTSTGTITSRSWKFGDGTTSTAQIATKTYSTAGTYAVSLTATNVSGSNTANQTVTVTQAETPPVASFTAIPSSGTTTTQITFTDTSPGTITSRSWDFGDGTTSTLQSTVKIYNTAGTYPVRLTTSNASGSNTANQTITITGTDAPPPTSSSCMLKGCE